MQSYVVRWCMLSIEKSYQACDRHQQHMEGNSNSACTTNWVRREVVTPCLVDLIAAFAVSTASQTVLHQVIL